MSTDAIEEAAETIGNYEALDRAVTGVLFWNKNYPEAVQPRLLGQNMRPLVEKVVDAVSEAGFTRVVKFPKREAVAKFLYEQDFPGSDWSSVEPRQQMSYRKHASAIIRFFREKVS